MKLEEDLKSVRYIRERIDLVVNEDGFVVLPAWQFALFVKEYESYRRSTIAWFVGFVLFVMWYFIFTTMLI